MPRTCPSIRFSLFSSAFSACRNGSSSFRTASISFRSPLSFPTFYVIILCDHRLFKDKSVHNEIQISMRIWRSPMSATSQGAFVVIPGNIAWQYFPHNQNFSPAFSLATRSLRFKYPSGVFRHIHSMPRRFSIKHLFSNHSMQKRDCA